MFSFGNKKAERRRRDMKGRPKLDRRNAAKNIDYEASWSPSSSEEPPSLRISRSLDLSPAAYSKTTSFRIAGSVEDEVDLLCRSLGLSGPDDFAIPIAVWEASLKARSSSDLLPRSRFFDSENPISGSDLPVQEAVPSEVVVSVRSSEHRSGIRPTVITPPPLPDSFIALPVEDRSSSNGDIVRCFGLKDENEDSEVEEEERETSEDCTVSFSASNDEDLPSTTDEFVISPSGRFKKVIRSWMRGQLLGSGSFGTVYEGISDDGTFIAVKEVSLVDKRSNAQQSILQLEQEIALLSQFEHENIVQYYGTDKEESKLFIFLELVTQGSLASLYQKYHLRDTQVSIYTRQILNGLNYLHERNVVHRDIKCANILVHANGSVKLADFGLAKKVSKFNDLKSCKGSVYWMAPEVVNPRKTYGRAPDIWSLGCTVLEMLTRQIPYPNVEWQHAFFKIGRGEQPPIPNHLSSDAQDFIRQCVQVDPNSRPTASQLLEHPFVRRSVII